MTAADTGLEDGRAVTLTPFTSAIKALCQTQAVVLMD